MPESGLLPPGTHEKIRRAAASPDPRHLRTALRRLAGWFGRDPAPGSEAAVRAALSAGSGGAVAPAPAVAGADAALDRALLEAVRDPKARSFFNIAHLKMATTKGYHDPWARNEAWRYAGQFSFYNRFFKGTFPGLGIATAAFAAYCAYEYVFVKDEHAHHAEGHH